MSSHKPATPPLDPPMIDAIAHDMLSYLRTRAQMAKIPFYPASPITADQAHAAVDFVVRRLDQRGGQPNQLGRPVIDETVDAARLPGPYHTSLSDTDAARRHAHVTGVLARLPRDPLPADQLATAVRALLGERPEEDPR